MLLLLLSISHYLMVLGNPCIETAQTTSGSSKNTIQSPGFPQVRPAGLYTCTYYLKSHLVDGRVYLVFDDFLSVCSIFEPECDNDKDLLKVYDGANTSFPLLGEFSLAKNERPPAMLSSGTNLYVEYIVASTYKTYEFSGFQASYSSIASQLPVPPTSVQTFMISKNGDGLIHFPVGGYEGEIDVLWLFKVGQISKQMQIYLYLHPNLSSADSSSILHLEVLDGISSRSSVLLNVSLPGASLSRDISLNSSHQSLYMRLRSESLKKSLGALDAVFSFFMDSGDGGPCLDFECDNGRCISSDLLCDGHDHCADGSDEVYCNEACQGVECANGGTCHGITRGKFHCICVTGFFGSRCKRSYKGCQEFYCANGGTCMDSIYVTPYCLCKEDYEGPNCELSIMNDDPAMTNECPQNYCFNGGTCFRSQEGYYCACPPLYSGELCMKRGGEGTSYIKVASNKTQYLLTLIIPLTLLIVIYMVCKFKRKSWPGNYPNQGSNRRHQFYHDHPPSYEQTVRPTSLNWSQEVEMVETRYEEPPPKYEDVIIVTETSRTTRDFQMRSLENGCMQPPQQSRMYSVHKLT